MKATRSIKLKLITINPELMENCLNYIEAANWLSKIVFDRANKNLNKNNKPKLPSSAQLQREFYGTARNKFNLPSQVACSLFRYVLMSYKSMISNFEWTQAIYKKLTMPICIERDFRLSKTKGLTIWGKKTEYQSGPIPNGNWSDSKLKYINKNWYLVLSVEIDIPEPKTTTITKENIKIMGVDSGQKNIFVAVDSKTGKTLYCDGKKFNHKRYLIRQNRKNVASVGTRSAYRLLKRLSGREKAVTQRAMHAAANQLVAFVQNCNVDIVKVEDLSGIRKSKKPMHHKQKGRNNRWPFALFEFFVDYKLSEIGVQTKYVNAAYTSRECPKCHHVEEANRNGLKFKCRSCQWHDHADRVGACNVVTRNSCADETLVLDEPSHRLIVAARVN